MNSHDTKNTATSSTGWKPGSRKVVFAEIISMGHPRAVVIFSLLTLVTALMAQRGDIKLWTAVSLVLAMAFVQVAIGVFNDYYDRDLDLIAKPHRALPAGMITPGTALAASWLAIALGLGTSAMLGIPSVLVLALGAGMGILYDVRLKRTALSWLPYAVAYPIVPLWVWVSLGKFSPELLLIFPVTIPFSVGIHLCNQLRDYDNDAAQGMKGLAQYLGKKAAGKLSLTLLLAGPLPALLITLGKRNSMTLLGIAILSHWLLVARCLASWDRKTDDLWHPLFRVLQVSSPLILIGWIYTSGP